MGLPLLGMASSVLGGGGPLGGITGEEGGPVTSTATSGPATTGSGDMIVGGTKETPWLLLAAAIVLAAIILSKR